MLKVYCKLFPTIYGDVSLPKEVQSVWEALAYPKESPNISIDLEQINYFDVPDDWLTKRIKGLLLEIDQILSVGITDVTNRKKLNLVDICRP